MIWLQHFYYGYKTNEVKYFNFNYFLKYNLIYAVLHLLYFIIIINNVNTIWNLP